MLLHERCQAQNSIASANTEQFILRRLHSGAGVRTLVRMAMRSDAPRAQYGQPSRFALGARVRVKSAAAMAEVLDAAGKTRGLQWVEQQWQTCAKVFTVSGHVRRIMDDDGIMRPIGRTVTLAGVTCDMIEPAGGCGRACPLFFRDDWLEDAVVEIDLLALAQPRTAPLGYARVRSRAAIAATLDLGGGREGVKFMAEMFNYCGRRLPIVKRISSTHEMGRDWPVKIPLYLLEGAICSGAVLGRRGPCDRGCALLWHREWIELEGAA